MRFFDVKEERHVVVKGDDLPLLARVTIWSLLILLLLWMVMGITEVGFITKAVVSIVGAALASFLIVERKVGIDLKKGEVTLVTRQLIGREKTTKLPLSKIQLIKSREICYGSLLGKKISYVLRLRYPHRGLDVVLAESSTESNLRLDTQDLVGLVTERVGESLEYDEGVIKI